MEGRHRALVAENGSSVVSLNSREANWHARQAADRSNALTQYRPTAITAEIQE